MNRRRQEKIRKRDSDKNELYNLREGRESIRTFFMSKDSKIQRITDLTNRIIGSEKDIECLDLLHKIVVLQLNQAAIQFFKRDKFTTYNHTVNLYMAKQGENNAMRMEVFRKINLQNLTMLSSYQEKKRLEDRSVLIEASEKVRMFQDQRRAMEMTIDDPAKVSSRPVASLGPLYKMAAQIDDSEDNNLGSTVAVRNGGYINAKEDVDEETSLQDEPNLMRKLRNHFIG